MTNYRQAILVDAPKWLEEEGYDGDGDSMEAAMDCIVSLLTKDDRISTDEMAEQLTCASNMLTHLDARMCVPRDMGFLPATTIRRLHQIHISTTM